MFILIFILIIFLLGAVLRLALETLFSSDELMDMGVYLEDLQAISITEKEQLKSSPSGSLCSCAGLSG